MNEKGRTLFYGIGAAYLLYLCYDLFQSGVGAGEATLPITLFCILFGVAGAGLAVLAVKQYKKYMQDAMADSPEEENNADTTVETVDGKKTDDEPGDTVGDDTKEE